MFNWIVQQLPSVPILLVLVGTTFLGCVMRGFTGFGNGLLMAPVFSLLMPPIDVVVMILSVNLLTTFQMLPGALRNVDWRLVGRLFVSSLFGLPAGLFMLHMVDPVFVRKAVSLMIVIMAVLMLVGWHYRGRRGLIQDAVVGVFSGFTTTIAGIGGPPVILYMLSDRTLPFAVMRAVCIVLFSLTQAAILALFAIDGVLNVQQGVYTVIVLPIAVLASLLGAFLHGQLGIKHQDRVRRFALLVLLAIGFSAFVM